MKETTPWQIARLSEVGTARTVSRRSEGGYPQAAQPVWKCGKFNVRDCGSYLF